MTQPLFLTKRHKTESCYPRGQLIYPFAMIPCLHRNLSIIHDLSDFLLAHFSLQEKQPLRKGNQVLENLNVALNANLRPENVGRHPSYPPSFLYIFCDGNKILVLKWYLRRKKLGSLNTFRDYISSLK